MKHSWECLSGSFDQRTCAVHSVAHDQPILLAPTQKRLQSSIRLPLTNSGRGPGGSVPLPI